MKVVDPGVRLSAQRALLGAISPEARTLALARMIESARQLWKVGESPGITAVVAPH